jgi:hypothetical protein
MFALLLLFVPAVPATYEKELRPVLAKHCVSCHNADRGRGGLDLSSFAGIQAGGNSGKAAISGKPEISPLYTMAAHLEDPVMPPGKPKIPEKDLLVLKTWIADGMIERPGSTAPIIVEGPKGGLVKPTLLPRPTAITALAHSPKGELLAVSGLRQAVLYNEGKVLGAVAFPEGEVHVLRFSRDGSILLVAGGVGGLSGKVAGFDTRTWNRLFTIGEEADTVLAADISPDKKRVVLGGPGRVVKIFDVASGKLLHALRKATDFITAVRYSPDGLLLAAGDRFGGMWVWASRSGEEFATLRGHTQTISSLEWNSESDTLLSASGDGTFRFWDMHKQQEVFKCHACEGRVLGMSLSSEGRLTTAGSDGRVKVWSKTGTLEATYGPGGDEVMHAVWASDGKTVYSGDWAGEVRVWPSNAKIALPIASTPPRVAVVLPSEPKIPTVPPLPTESGKLSAQEELRLATEELEEARRALGAAEAAAASLRKLVESRAAAVEKATQRLRKTEGDE